MSPTEKSGPTMQTKCIFHVCNVLLESRFTNDFTAVVWKSYIKRAGSEEGER